MPSGLGRSKIVKGPIIKHLSPESLSGGPYDDYKLHSKGMLARPVNSKYENHRGTQGNRVLIVQVDLGGKLGPPEIYPVGRGGSYGG